MKRIGKIAACLLFVLMLMIFAQAQNTKSVKGVAGKEHYISSNGLKVYLWEKYHKAFANSNFSENSAQTIKATFFCPTEDTRSCLKKNTGNFKASFWDFWISLNSNLSD